MPVTAGDVELGSRSRSDGGGGGGDSETLQLLKKMNVMQAAAENKAELEK